MVTMRLYLLSPIFLILLTFSSLQAQLIGNYTIGGAAPDYVTIGAAVDDLNANGISGDVFFLIRTGSYDEQVTITNFARTGNADDTVSITRENMGSSVTWEYSTAGASTNWVVKLNGADYVILQGIDFEASAPSPFGRLVVFENGADNNIVRNGSMQGILGAATDEGSLVYGVGTKNESNTIDNQSFTNGYRGIDFESTSGSRADGNQVIDSSFGGQFDDGIRLRYQTTALIDNNTLNDAAWSSTAWTGVEVDGEGSAVTHNAIDSQLGENGIRLLSVGSTSPDRLIANNLINMRGSNVNAGIAVTTGRVDVYHNTVRVGGAGQLLTPIIINGGSLSDIHLKNNLFVNDGGGYAMRVLASGNLTSSDYNNFYTSGGFLVEWDGLPEADLSAYQSTSGFDANSADIAITFVDIIGMGDLHLDGSSNGDPILSGDPVPEVLIDYDNDSRDPYNPYMGADEASLSISPLDNADTGSGYYTIGGGTPDFTDPSHAIDHLNSRGIKGKTTFRVRAGTYAVNKVIEDFTRYGSLFGGGQDTVIFRPSNLVNIPVLRHAAITPSDNWVLKLDGADGVIFRYLNFLADGAGAWGNVIVFENGADDNVFENCSFTGLTGQTDSSAGIIYADLGLTGDRNVFESNTIVDGSYAIYARSGDSDSRYISNTIQGFSQSGIRVEGDDVVIDRNTITGPDPATTVNNGIYLGSDGDDFQITRNQILMPGVNQIGLTLFGAGGTVSPALLANNFITSDIGVRLSAAANVNIFNNTIYSTGSRGLEVFSNSGSDISILNNVLYNAGAPIGYALYVEEAADISNSDYNFIFNGSPTDNVIHWDGTDYLTLFDFQAATSLQERSMAPNGGLTFDDAANADLHISLGSPNITQISGTPLPEITDDFDGDPRGVGGFPIPFIGADERLDIGPLGVTASLKILLSGPHNITTSLLNTDLNSFGILDVDALVSPYATCDPASVSAGFFAANPSIVDWVCVRLMSGTAPSLTEMTNSVGFINEFGEIVNLSGSGTLFFTATRDDLYAIIEHRNHLRVMTHLPLDFNSTLAAWDARANPAIVYTSGGAALNDLGAGQWGMWGGDGDGSNDVTAFDFLNVWLPANGGAPGYHNADFDMSSDVTSFDFLTVWLLGNGLASQVP